MSKNRNRSITFYKWESFVDFGLRVQSLAAEILGLKKTWDTHTHTHTHTQANKKSAFSTLAQTMIIYVAHLFWVFLWTIKENGCPLLHCPNEICKLNVNVYKTPGHNHLY